MLLISMAIDACGLSIREAASFLRISENTLRDAINRPHKTRTPPGWLAELRQLQRIQRRQADEALAIIRTQAEAHGPGNIELGFCTDDTEARSLNLPCKGAHDGVLRMIWEGLPDGCAITLSPRGSTIGTAAAAHAHGR